MSALSCAEVRELAPELALGILSGAERAEVLLHVNGCARCQAYVAELTEAADAIPQLAPEAEPPAGFEGRVLRRLGEGERRTRRRWIAAAAGVAAAGDHRERHRGAGRSSRTTALAAGGSAPPTTITAQAGGGADGAHRGRTAAGWAYVRTTTVWRSRSTTGSRPACTPWRSRPLAARRAHRDHAGQRQARLVDRAERRPIASRGTGSHLVDATGTEMCHGTVPMAR